MVRYAPASHSAVALGVAAALASFNVHSADAAQGETLEPIVVTATRSPVPVSRLVSDVTVLTRQDIEKAVAQDLSDLLRQQPGLEIARNGGPGGQTSVFIRGADNRFTALLIDGVRVAAQSGDGGAPWLNLPLSQIERVEIVRGPAGSIYGSDAVAGVIQVFTRKTQSARPVLALGAGIGSRGTSQADVFISGQQSEVDYSIAMSTERSRGTSSVVNPASMSYNPDADGYRRHANQGRLGWQLNQVNRLEFSAFESRVDSQYDAYASALDNHSLNALNTNGITWSAQWLENWSSQLAANESFQVYETKPGSYKTETTSRTVTFQNDWQSGEHGLHVIAESRRDDLKNAGLSQSPTTGRADRSVTGVAAGYDFHKNGHAIQLNLRSDDDSDFGRHDTGSLAVGLAVVDGLRVTGSLANAFKAPTLYQRFSQYGTANLQAESSKNAELGAYLGQGGLKGSVVLYRNRVGNLIDYSDGCNCYQNVGKAVLKGVTLQANGQISAVQLTGSLDFQSPRNEDTGEQLLRRARRSARVQVDSTLFGWDTGVQLLATSSRSDKDWDPYPAVNVQSHGYTTLNLTLGKSLSANWRVQMKLENALQREYQDAYGYGGNGRKLMLTVRWNPTN